MPLVGGVDGVGRAFLLNRRKSASIGAPNPVYGGRWGSLQRLSEFAIMTAVSSRWTVSGDEASGLDDGFGQFEPLVGQWGDLPPGFFVSSKGIGRSPEIPKQPFPLSPKES